MKKTVGKYTLETMDMANWYNNWLFSEIEAFLKGNILEIGAGVGSFTKLLSKKGNITAIDINSNYIKKLQKKYEGKVKVDFGDIEKGKYFFGNRKFDTVVCMNVLEHIKNDKKALENIYKLLKSSGQLVLLVPAHMMLFSKFDKKLGHWRRYVKRDLVGKLEDVGFKVKRIKYLNWWAAIGWFIFMKLFKLEKLPEKELSVFDKLGRIFLWPERFISPPFGLSVFVVAEK